ncbi:HACE1 isoform 8, partial [Pongo abelii]
SLRRARTVELPEELRGSPGPRTPLARRSHPGRDEVSLCSPGWS